MKKMNIGFLIGCLLIFGLVVGVMGCIDGEENITDDLNEEILEGYDGFSHFNITFFNLDYNSNLTIIFERDIEGDIELLDINAFYTKDECNLIGVFEGTLDYPKLETQIKFDSILISYGKEYWAALDCGDSTDLNSSYLINLEFYYRDMDSGLFHISRGSLFGFVDLRVDEYHISIFENGVKTSI